MTKPAAGRLTLCRWGRAEYEGDDLSDLGATMVDDPAVADVVVVPSIRRVVASDVPRARLVMTTTSGFDNLDVPGLRAAGIRCARLPLARRDAVVETTIGMILSLTRRLGAFQAAAAEDRWDRARLGAYGATRLGRVGVVGIGVIGSRICAVLDALGAEVVPCRRGDPLPVDVDVLTLHCSLHRENLGMVGVEELARMRRGAIVVNTARGRLVDADAAAAAVRSGHLGGLALDVFPTEPASLKSYVHPSILVTPHAAGWHPGLGNAIAAGVATALRALEADEPVPWSL